MDKKGDNRANQKNPNNDSYYKARGYSEKPKNWGDQQKSSSSMTKKDEDQRSRQLNPNNKEYYNSRK